MTDNLFNPEAFEQMPGQMSMEGQAELRDFRHRCRCGHRHDEHESTSEERYSGRCKYVLQMSGKRCRCEFYRPRPDRSES